MFWKFEDHRLGDDKPSEFCRRESLPLVEHAARSDSGGKKHHPGLVGGCRATKLGLEGGGK